MYKIFLSLVCVASLSAEVVGGVAIIVKGEPITMLEIKKEMQASKTNVNMASDILIRKKLEQAEISERRLEVSSEDVYTDIKKTAARNNLSVSEFYEAIRSSNGLSSEEVKESVKHRLLSQNLYSSIAYAQMEQPSDSEIEEYYKLHKESFVHPSSFTVVIYEAVDKALLEQKKVSPMFYSPDIKSSEEDLPYGKIPPELASLLERTAQNHFTPVIANAKGSFVTFYIKEVLYEKDGNLESVKEQIANAIMAEKREQVLSDYFARLRVGADIVILRLPESF